MPMYPIVYTPLEARLRWLAVALADRILEWTFHRALLRGIATTMRCAAGALALVALVACGQNDPLWGPTPAITPPPVSVSVIDGISGQALDSRAGTVGSPVTISRDGYLRRDTLLPASGPVTLWPNTVSEEWVRALVYEWTGVLMRWDSPTITIAADYPEQGIAEVNILGFMTLVPAATGPAITWTIDPSDPEIARQNALAVTYLTQRGSGRIAAARVVFRDGAVISSRTPAHELGHVLGLSHSPRNQDLMATGQRLYERATYFSPDERILLAMMYAHRRAGQVAPDNDQGLGAASLTTRTIVVVD